LTNQGFIGNATINNLCRCDEPNQVLWHKSQPYCIDVPSATELQVNNTLSQALVKQVRRVFDNTIYPTPLLILNHTVSLDDLFDPNAVGRIDPLTIIIGGSVLVEYFYAFTVAPPTRIISVDYLTFAVNVTGPLPKVFVRVRAHFVLALPGGGLRPVLNYTLSGTFAFGPDNRILKVDMILHNLGFITDLKLANRTLYVQSFCDQVVNVCTPNYDPTGFYANVSDCINFVSSSNVRNTTWNGAAGNLPATYDQAAGNTIICRQVHVNMAVFDPVTHCPHAGKTGGGFCTDAANGLFGPNPGPYYSNYDNAAFQNFD